VIGYECHHFQCMNATAASRSGVSRCLAGGPPTPARAATDPQALIVEAMEVVCETAAPPAPATARDAAVDGNESDEEALGTSSDIDDASE
jgi:hypothetical protein